MQNLNSIYNGLIWRNRYITILRFIVPLAGFLILSLLIAQIFIANIGKDYNISGVRLERDKVVIQTPQYNGTMANGTTYFISSETANTEIGGGDIFDLNNAKFDMTRKDGLTMQIKSKQAIYNILDESVYVKERMIVNDSRGIKAELFNSLIDWNKQTLVTKDSVKIEFSDGSILNSKTLTYDNKSSTWKFNDVIFVMEGN